MLIEFQQVTAEMGQESMWARWDVVIGTVEIFTSTPTFCHEL